MKLNLLKKLFALSPVVISPVLVTACGNSGNKNKFTVGDFYLKTYQNELNAVWKTKNSDINKAAMDFDHQYNIKINLLNEVLTKVKTDGASEFKKDFPELNNYDASIFDDITISFSVPKNSSGNLKASGNILTVYPTSIMSGASGKRDINYNLTLKSSKASGKALSGSLPIDLKAEFINYNKNSGLDSNIVLSVYGSANLSEILVGTSGGGLEVGEKQASGGYKFSKYNTSSASKLASNYISNVYGNADLSTILVGSIDGLDVGTKQKDGSYKFDAYNSSNGLASDHIRCVYANPDMSEILVGTDGSGLDVGIRQKDNSYQFVKYNDKSGLSSNLIMSAFGNVNLSTILIGSTGGLDVGTRQGPGYTFKNYSTSGAPGKKLNDDNVYDVYGSTNLDKILVGEQGGGLDVGTKQSDDSYNFVNYNSTSSGSTLSGDNIEGVYGNADLSTILVGTLSGGLDVGTKSGDSYTFRFYNTSSDIDLSSNNIYCIYTNSNLSTILLGTKDAGLDISSNLWFA